MVLHFVCSLSDVVANIDVVRVGVVAAELGVVLFENQAQVIRVMEDVVLVIIIATVIGGVLREDEGSSPCIHC